MKGILIALAFLPGMAFAHGSGVQCKMMGDLGEITFTIAAEDGLTQSPKVRVVVDGVARDMDLQAQSEPFFTQDPNEVILLLKTLVKDTEQIDPNGIEATLTLKTNVLSQDPAVVALAGNGTLHITKRPPRPRLRPVYNLTNCQGAI